MTYLIVCRVFPIPGQAAFALGCCDCISAKLGQFRREGARGWQRRNSLGLVAKIGTSAFEGLEGR